jgi:hypothetical protein
MKKIGDKKIFFTEAVILPDGRSLEGDSLRIASHSTSYTSINSAPSWVGSVALRVIV